MKYFTLEKIEKDSFHSLMDFLNQEWEKTVYINSPWWDISYTEMILKDINSRTDVVLVANCIMSSGFRLFYWFNGKKYIMTWAYWMLHRSYTSNIIIDNRGKVTYPDHKCAVKSIKQQVNPTYKNLKKKEVKDYKKWYDVYFTFKRLKELFPAVEVIQPN